MVKPKVNKMPSTFIYRSINGRVSAEKLNFEPLNSSTGKPHDLGIIFKKELTDKEKNMTLRELMVTYPYQKGM